MLDAKEALDAQSRMEGARSSFDQQWQEAAELFLPRQADFPSGGTRMQGQDRSNQIFDEYGQQCADDGTSVFEGNIMPRGQLWQLITPADDELAKLQHVAAWYEAKSRKLHKYRADARSGFVQESNESAASLMVFGNQAMECEHLADPVTKLKIGLRYRSEHIGRVYIEENWQGLPSRKHVKFRMSAAQAMDRFGSAMLERAPQVAKAANGTPADKAREFEWLRVIKPNPSVDVERMDWRGKPWTCGFLSIADKEFVDIGGYRASPITYSRFRKSPTETYGRGPGTDTLPAVKAAQAIMIDLMVAAEMGLRPPLGAPDDATDMLINYAAGEITYGARDRRGNKMIDVLFEVADSQGALGVQEMVHRVLDRAFFRHLLFTNQDMKSHVTDGQLFERTQEKGVLLAPLGRQEGEWFTPMLDREIDNMAQMGDFDDMPGEVREAGGIYGATYDNPLNRMLRAQAAGGYYRALDKVVAVAQYRPEALDIFFREYPLEKALRGIGDIEAIPASWAATTAEKDAFDKAAAQQKQAAEIQQLAATLEPVGRAARDLSGAMASG
jgi:hypothetical protein